MDPKWNELRQELNDGPFAQKGFTKQLQLQIEHNLEQKHTVSKRKLFKLAGACAAALLIVISLTRVDWGHSTRELTAAVPSVNNTQNEHKPLMSSLPFQVKSVLLLGLRTDIHEKSSSQALVNNTYSTYRTLMIAADPKDTQRVQLAAEGKGLLVPHGQHFWLIEALTQETPNDIYHYLAAHPASIKAVKRSYPNTPDEQLHLHEKLVYAGNNYASIVTEEEDWRGNAPRSSQIVWTRALEQINTAAGQKADDHVSLQKLFGNQTKSVIAQIQPKITAAQGGMKSEITGENWTLIRQTGKWVPLIAENEFFNNNAAANYELHPFPLAMPDNVVSHDKLIMSWDEIKRVQPDALDAVSSPDEDMVAVITGSKLFIYPYRNNEIGPLALQVDLHTNESMVMAQWATAKYADNWVEEGRRYLKK